MAQGKEVYRARTAGADKTGRNCPVRGHGVLFVAVSRNPSSQRPRRSSSEGRSSGRAGAERLVFFCQCSGQSLQLAVKSRYPRPSGRQACPTRCCSRF